MAISKKSITFAPEFKTKIIMKEKVVNIISICLMIIGFGGLIGINVHLRMEYKKEYERTKVAVEQVAALFEQAVNEQITK